jgi:hypothetical protein
MLPCQFAVESRSNSLEDWRSQCLQLCQHVRKLFRLLMIPASLVAPKVSAIYSPLDAVGMADGIPQKRWRSAEKGKATITSHLSDFLGTGTGTSVRILRTHQRPARDGPRALHNGIDRSAIHKAIEARLLVSWSIMRNGLRIFKCFRH